MLALSCAALAALGCAPLAALAGCSSPQAPPAVRVCRGDLHALRRILPRVRLRIVDRHPANIACRFSGDGLRLDVVAQASPRAWTEFDTLVVHAAQAVIPGTPGHAANLPRDLAGLGYNAAWIPAKRQFLATNGTQSSGGSFVTITVRRTARHGPPALALARAAATATLSSAPRGPSPGPPPS